MVGWLAQREKNEAVGRLLHNLSQSASEAKIFVPTVRDQNIKEATSVQKLVMKQKHHIPPPDKYKLLKLKRQMCYLLVDATC